MGRFVVSNGGEMSALYLRSLREQGFSRRAELGKLIQGDMAAFEEAQKPKEEVVEEKTEEEKKAEAIDRAKEYEELFAESRKQAAEQRERAISAKAREWLSGRWEAKNIRPPPASTSRPTSRRTGPRASRRRRRSWATRR